MIEINLILIEGTCIKSCPHCICLHYKNADYITLNEVKTIIHINDNNLEGYGFSFIPGGEPLIHEEIFDIFDELILSKAKLMTIATNLCIPLSDYQLLFLINNFINVEIDISEVNQNKKLMDRTKINLNKILELSKINNSKCNIIIKRVYHPNQKKPIYQPCLELPLVVLSHKFVEFFIHRDTKEEQELAIKKYYSDLDIEESVLISDKNIINWDTIKVESKHCRPCSGLRISPFGGMSFCVMVPPSLLHDDRFYIGNVLTTSLYDILHNPNTVEKAILQYNKKLIPELCSLCKCVDPEVELTYLPESLSSVFK